MSTAAGARAELAVTGERREAQVIEHAALTVLAALRAGVPAGAEDLAVTVLDRIRAYHGLLDGTEHPASAYPDLARGWPDDALGQAVSRVLEDIRAGDAELSGLIYGCAGESAEGGTT